MPEPAVPARPDASDAPLVAVLGVGKLGGALVAGLLQAGHPADRLLGAERSPALAQEVAARHGIATPDPVDAAARADVVLVAVKPQDVVALLAEVGPSLRPGAVVVSLAAGLTTAALEAPLPDGTSVVRVMTNTPLLVGEAMSAMSAGGHATDAQLEQVEALLRTVGRVVRVPEAQQDAVTALSGCGPAYFFYVVEAMVDAGVLLGLPRAVAAELVVQTAVGAAAMLRDGEHPVLLREAVSSPGGSTIAATRALEDAGVRAGVMRAAEVARDRTRQLAAGV